MDRFLAYVTDNILAFLSWRTPSFSWFLENVKVLQSFKGVHVSHSHLRNTVLSPPVTSRSPREEEQDGQSYRFVTRGNMERDIKDGHYLEHGEYDRNLYGTKMGSIHEVVRMGRTCILDVNPQVG